MITIYARKDLGYRRGKMIAQASHALMKLILQSLKFENNVLLASSKTHSNLSKVLLSRDSVEIVWVDSKEALEAIEIVHPKYCASIIDNGKTESNGIPTLTCLAVDNSRSLKKVREVTFSKNSYNTKQHLIVNKSVSNNKESQMAIGAKTSCYALFFGLQGNDKDGYKLDLNKEVNANLSDWLNGAFAKIGLKITDQMDSYTSYGQAGLKGIASFHSAHSIQHDLHPLITAIGPASVEELEGVSNHFSLY